MLQLFSFSLGNIFRFSSSSWMACADLPFVSGTQNSTSRAFSTQKVANAKYDEWIPKRLLNDEYTTVVQKLVLQIRDAQNANAPFRICKINYCPIIPFMVWNRIGRPTIHTFGGNISMQIVNGSGKTPKAEIDITNDRITTGIHR